MMKMKSLLSILRPELLLLVVLISGTLWGQQWDWNFPKAGSNFHKVTRYLGNNIWITAGEAGAIFRSSDDGNNWYQVYTPIGNRYFDDVFVLNNDIVYAVGYRGEETPYSMIIKSTDGGLNWSTLYTTENTLTKLWFTNELTGFALSGGYIQKTTDGGITWSDLILISPGYGFSDMQFVDSQTGFLCGGFGSFAKTTDGGQTWSSSRVNPSLSLYSVHFLSPLIGFVAGQSELIYKTIDGGINWVSYAPEGLTAIEDIEFSGGTGYAVGWFGVIYRTTNAGLSWAKEESPPSAGEYLYSVAVKDSGIAVASGGYGVVYRREYTREWSNKNRRKFGTATSIAWPTSVDGFVTISDGFLLSTSDGGSNWQERKLVEGVYTPKVIFADQNHGVIFTWCDTFFYTSNRGISWDKHLLPAGINGPNTAFFATPLVGYAVGNAGAILKTTDGGFSWTYSTGPDGANLHDVFFFDANTGIIASYWNGIHKTTDGGITWTRKASYPAISISFPTPLIGYSAGHGGYVLKTTNGGEDWFQVTVPLYSLQSYSTLFIDETTGYISGPHIYKTTDGGISWFSERDAMGSSDRTVYDMELSPNGSLWAVSSFSGIHKLRENPVTGGSIQIPEVNAGAGGVVVVPVIIDVPLHKNFTSVQFTVSGYGENLTFDSLYLANTICERNEWLAYANPAGNSVRFSASGFPAQRGGGILVNLCFTVGMGTTSRIPLNFSHAVLDDGAAPFDTLNGGIQLLIARYGDVDLNGVVQAFDASLIQQYILGLMPLNAQQRLNANVTTDAEITSFDASVILRYVVGLITSLPYNGSVPASAVFAMEQLPESQAGYIDVPLFIENTEGVYSVDAELHYDKTLLAPLQINNGKAFKDYGVISRYGNGVIKVSLAGTKHFSNSLRQDIVSIRFAILNKQEGSSTSEILIHKIRVNEETVKYDAGKITVNLHANSLKSLPDAFAVYQNFPNPFNPVTSLTFDLPAESEVRITIYSGLGSEIYTMLRTYLAGRNTFQFDGTGFSSGIYFARIQTGSYHKIIKMILNK